MYNTRHGKKAFSLIELLIVVAIIAILAAIAAPNYMDALTRSKVARFEGDCKAAETAIEVYYSDWSYYPPADRWPVQSTSGNWWTSPSNPGEGFLSRRLTTPTAYMTKIPRDVFFNEELRGTYMDKRVTYNFSTDSQNQLIYGSSTKGNWVSNFYAKLKGMRATNTARPSNAAWMIASPGANKRLDYRTGVEPIQYDATNGIESDGDLFMFGPGLGFGLKD
jgi:prepilin-type N-terminal cleavage/methylation domain-containing protein